MRRLIAATTALLLGTTLAGCTDSDQPDPPPPTSTPTPIEPTATETDGPPELPEAATEKTTAGAKAFIAYYIAVINHGLTKNDPGPLASASTPRCEPCSRIIESIRANSRRGGGQVGGEWHPEELSPVGGQPISRPVIVAAIDVDKGHYRTRDGGPRHPIDAKRVIYEFWIRWTGTSWLVQDVRAT